LNCGLTFNFQNRLILNLHGQELIIFLQTLNRTFTMCSDKTLNYECTNLNQSH